jgi:hypothetical protein
MRQARLMVNTELPAGVTRQDREPGVLTMEIQRPSKVVKLRRKVGLVQLLRDGGDLLGGGVTVASVWIVRVQSCAKRLDIRAGQREQPNEKIAANFEGESVVYLWGDHGTFLTGYW